MCKRLGVGNWKLGFIERLANKRWVVYLFFGLMTVIAFQGFINNTTVISRCTLNHAQMSSRTVLRVE
jgi:hypothetical protein